MVEFIRDVVVVLALLMSLFALAYYQTPGEGESARSPAPPGSLIHSGSITVPAATAVSAAK